MFNPSPSSHPSHPPPSYRLLPQQGEETARFEVKVKVAEKHFLSRNLRVTVDFADRDVYSLRLGVRSRKNIPNVLVVVSLLLDFFQICALQFPPQIPFFDSDPFPAATRLFIMELPVVSYPLIFWTYGGPVRVSCARECVCT